ncbi:hypothetical protein VAEKB19_1630001 [Vibrio aestuarianus]|nr:hypothetical protein VAEKB19_1630001 [Vibrio aestuarianus]
MPVCSIYGVPIMARTTKSYKKFYIYRRLHFSSNNVMSEAIKGKDKYNSSPFQIYAFTLKPKL